MFSIIYWNAWKCRSLQVFHEWFRTWVKINGLPDVICLSEVMAMLGTNKSPYFAASTEGRPPVDLNGLQTLVTLLPEYTYFYQSRDVREHKMEDGSTKPLPGVVQFFTEKTCLRLNQKVLSCQ